MRSRRGARGQRHAGSRHRRRMPSRWLCSPLGGAARCPRPRTPRGGGSSCSPAARRPPRRRRRRARPGRPAKSPGPTPAVQEAMATDLGAEYMELVARAYHPGRVGDLQLLLAPFNSANYPQESRSLVPPRPAHEPRQRRGCTSSGSRSSCTAPGVIEPARLRGARVARRRRADDRRARSASTPGRADREGRPLPGLARPASARGRRHLRDRRRRLERAAALARTLAAPQSR